MNWLLSLLIIFLVCQQHLMSPVPPGDEADQQAFDDVKDLESLRTEINKSNTDSHRQDNGGNHKEETDAQNTPAPVGEEEGQANSRSAIFRHRGITEAKKNKYWNDEAQQPIEGYPKFAGIQTSPTDLAAYVFYTGDEEGVSIAVEELVREGMMGRTDAINYLQDVKQVLSYMREQYEEQKKLQELKNRAYPKPQVTQRLLSPPREQFVSQLITDKREPKAVVSPQSPVVTTEHPHQEVIASTSESKQPTYSASTTVRPKTEASPVESIKDDDYKRRVKEKTAQNSYDFTLKVIYKLSKDMFSQSILRDDPTAEETLSGLVTFLEGEVGNKRISPEMKEKVLEVVSAALVDSLRDYQGMLPDNQAPTFDEAGLFRHLPEPSMSKRGIPEVYHQLGVGGHDNILQLTSKNNRPKSS